MPSSNVLPKTQTVMYRNIKKVNIEAFRNDLEQSIDVIVNQDDNSFKAMCTRFHEISSSVVDKHSPMQQRKCMTSQPKWMDQEYKQSRQLRRKYEKAWKKNRNDDNMKKYIEQKQICVDLALVKQSHHYSKIIVDAVNCQRSLLKIANELLDKTKEKVLPSYTDPKNLANEFNNYYVNKVKKIRESIPAIPENTTVLLASFCR